VCCVRYECCIRVSCEHDDDCTLQSTLLYNYYLDLRSVVVLLLIIGQLVLLLCRFVGAMGRDEAQKLLDTMRPGTYLVRESVAGTRQGEYALSLR
jgi:hypothetical protein